MSQVDKKRKKIEPGRDVDRVSPRLFKIEYFPSYLNFNMYILGEQRHQRDVIQINMFKMLCSPYTRMLEYGDQCHANKGIAHHAYSRSSHAICTFFCCIRAFASWAFIIESLVLFAIARDIRMDTRVNIAGNMNQRSNPSKTSTRIFCRSIFLPPKQFSVNLT